MATDWQAQAQAGVERWIEAQRAWWAQVSAPTAQGAGEAGGADALAAAIEAWRDAAHRIVDAQSQALLAALREPDRGEADQLVREWTDAQRKMWEDWLAVAGGASGGAGADPGRDLLDSLREAAERLVRSQAEWAGAWTGAEVPSERRDGP